jgi:hypothetical protein
VVWARTLEAWKVGVARSQTNETGSGLLAPFSDALGHQVGAAAASPQRTHAELTAAIRKRVPVGLTDLADSSQPRPPPPPPTTPTNGFGGGGGPRSAAAAKAAAAKALADKTAKLVPAASSSSGGGGGSSGGRGSAEVAALEAPAGADMAAALCALGAEEATEAVEPLLPGEAVDCEDDLAATAAGVVVGDSSSLSSSSSSSLSSSSIEGSKPHSPGLAEGPHPGGSGGVLAGGGWPLGAGAHAGLLEGNPLVVKFGLLELASHGLLLSAWAPVLAVLTVQGHLLLLPVPRAALAAATRRFAAAVSARGGGGPLPTGPGSLPPSWALAEALALLDPVSPPVAPGATRAAAVAAQARAAAASRAGPLPSLQCAAVVPLAALVVAACDVAWAPNASACGCALEVNEHARPGSDRGSGGLSWGHLLPAAWGRGNGQTLELKASTQAECFEWVTALRRLSRNCNRA